MTRPLIAYVRVSTSKQGRSGLGLEAQQEALSRFADAEGFELVRTFIEVETGKGSDALERRPLLLTRTLAQSDGSRQSIAGATKSARR
jgi:DNA invertase Pin-like site-specific DNA recombinase